MSTCIQNHDLEDENLAARMEQSLKINYPRLFETVKKHWELSYAGKDPSDACVSIRVSSSESPKRSVPCAGVRRRRGRLLA